MFKTDCYSHDSFSILGACAQKEDDVPHVQVTNEDDDDDDDEVWRGSCNYYRCSSYDRFVGCLYRTVA